ncbi:MAG: ChaN family lipoprotein [Planctomycetes bacterium]|nr:ChaN family lipoprotein [Planctomycetota bacterium]MCB9872175.1 ChaN family lipoprotein [Planctomycetota bacterium]
MRLSTVLLALLAWTTPSCRYPAPPVGVELDHYIDAHYRDLGECFVRPLDRAEFGERLEHCRVLFLGDHHRDSTLHAAILELIDWLCARGKHPVLGIEAVGIEDNASLQEFLAGGVSLGTLRERIARRWARSWLEPGDVDHAFYRSLLVRARRSRLPVFCLEPAPRAPLDERDATIASNIRRALRLHPDRLVVVVVGHAHLLGLGNLTARVDAPCLTFGARVSPRLKAKAADLGPVPVDALLRSDRGVLFFPVVVHGSNAN